MPSNPLLGHSEQRPLTVAEREALEFIAARAGDRGIYSSALHVLYERRFRAQCEAEGRAPYTNTARRSAWKRTSGSTMARLHRKGYLRYALNDGYATRYTLADAGREALNA